MYVERLKIENFRNIRETEFDLNYPGKENGARLLPNVNLFLGDNGSGKTSVFKALTLAILTEDIAFSGFRSDFLVRRASGATDELPEEATLSPIIRFLENTDDASDIPLRILTKTEISPGSDQDQIRLNNEFSVSVGNHPWLDEDVLAQGIVRLSNVIGLLIGYGANRRTAPPEGFSEATRSKKYQRVASIFEDHVGLIPFDYGLLQLEKLGVFFEARVLLNNLLPGGVQLAIDFNPRLYRPFTYKGINLPFSSLSDGFRVFVGWVWDMLVQLALNAKPGELLVDQRGIVIVDEIDLLLHPEWQRVVIPKVANAFPNIQFCFSTHSPLVAGTVEKENLFVMETEPDGSAIVRQYREDIHGLTPNQILTSSYFGLASVRAPGTGTLADLAQRTLNGNGSTSPPPPDPTFNEWLNGALEKEANTAEKPKRTRRKKTPQD